MTEPCPSYLFELFGVLPWTGGWRPCLEICTNLSIGTWAFGISGKVADSSGGALPMGLASARSQNIVATSNSLHVG